MTLSSSYSRQLKDDLEPEVLEVPPPPTPTLAPPFAMRVAHAYGPDLDLVHRWMNAPHVAPFWDQDWPKDQWADHLRRMLADTYSRPYIVSYQGRDVAYVELYRAARDVVAEHYPASPYDIGLHGAIGEADLVGKNIGWLFWLRLIPAVFTSEAQCRRVVTDPDASHRVARRLDSAVAAKVGGQLYAEVDLPHKRAALFIYPRTPEDLPAAKVESID